MTTGAKITAACISLAIFSSLGLSPAAAQDDSSRTLSASPQRGAPACWRGHPAPRCGVFWITEFGYDGVVGSTRTRYGASYSQTDFGGALLWTVGPMFNRGPNRALGATLTLSGANAGTRFALEGRFRRWLGSASALDLSAGYAQMDVSGPPGAKAYGVTGGAALIGGDLIGVSTHADMLFGYGKPRVGMTAGIRLGSYAAAAGTLALFTLGIIALASLRGD